MNLVSLLAGRAGRHPDRPALVDSRGGVDRVVTYGELARRMSAGANELQQMGLARGQVVLVFQPVSIELYEFVLAAFHAGLQVMLADPSAGGEFLSNCCRRLSPDAFFGSWKAHCLKLTNPEMRRIPISICSNAWFPGAKRWRTDSTGAGAVEMGDDEPALVTFTSGSTGIPKAAVRTHGFLLAQHRALSRALEFEDGEVDLITLPVFVLANLASGLTCVLAATDLAKPGSPDVAAVTAQCRKYGVTRCAASPAFFEGFLRSPEALPAFEKVFTGGAPVFPDLLLRLRESLPEARIHSVYGSTEAEPIAHFPADDANEETCSLTRQGGGLCAGLPVAEIELRIITDHWGTPVGPMNESEFANLSVRSGQAGEIVVSGDHVLRGYLGGAGDEETKIHVGKRVWHRTGDAGWIDARNRVRLLGRCAEKLPAFPAARDLPDDAPRYPFAIECALRKIFPNIRTAALDWKGRRTLVVGKKCDAAEIAEIEAKAAELGMARVIYLESLPLDRRHNAKIDYPTLRVALEK
jgi:acyl-CoA synthetase (AMP-forming)/AMP-acid ligase II